MIRLLIADKNYTCSACGNGIPQGHKYWKRGTYGGKHHTNCEEYSLKREVNITEYVNTKDYE